jgi:hypothetical protein
MNKELCIKVGKWNKSILWCTVKKHQNSNDNSNRDLSFIENIDNRIPDKGNEAMTEILSFIVAISVHVRKIMELGRHLWAR